MERHEQEWPLARTRSTRFYLDTTDRALVPEQAGEGSITAYAKAVEARMTWDTSARAAADIPSPPDGFRAVEREWGGLFERSYANDIHSDLATAGDGARGVLVLHDSDTEATHIANVVNDRGTVRIHDGQIERTYTSFDTYVQDTGYDNPNLWIGYRRTYLPMPWDP